MTTEPIDRNLANYAHTTAQTLHVPFVTIALSNCGGATYVDSDWAAGHPDVDCADLAGPASAAAKTLPFFAAVPIRSHVGMPLGYVTCGDSNARDLSEDELDILKHVATNIAAHITTASAFASH